MPVECLAHLFCVCMAVATGKVGPVHISGSVNYVGVSHGPAFNEYGFVLLAWFSRIRAGFLAV